MGSSAVIWTMIAAASTGATISRTDFTKQETVYKNLWNDNFVWALDELPTKGHVPRPRIPYSGYIYLDKEGGTADVLSKYDRAIHGNSYPATAWERSDTSAARRQVGRLFRSRTVVNHWYGHCNGWSSAAVRHAEPRNSVNFQGVRFSPADIKGLLAEVYMYNRHEMLAGYESNLNAGILHAILANWLGRGSHAVVMDSDPGEEKWNYPIFSYASSIGRHSPREVEVRTNIAYAKDSEDGEHNKSPEIREVKSFHYMLELDHRGNIAGGYYFNDSDRIDFLWVPLSPTASGQDGNESGNPHLDVNTVLAIWRKSVPSEVRRQWLIVDPADKDRAVFVPDPDKVLPRNIRIVPAAVAEPDQATE